jgi:hypothetical protein
VPREREELDDLTTATWHPDNFTYGNSVQPEGSTTMRYLALIYSDERADAAMTPDEQNANMAAWMSYSEDLGKSGKMLGGEALQPTLTATTIRHGNGGNLITDGPFAETKEQLGGYFVINADNLDEAIAWVGKMPHLPRGGSVEIRPIMEFGTDGAAS